MLNDMTTDSEPLSAMILAWYMSGSYTGLYQGHRMSKEEAVESAPYRTSMTPSFKEREETSSEYVEENRFVFDLLGDCVSIICPNQIVECRLLCPKD